MPRTGAAMPGAERPARRAGIARCKCALGPLVCAPPSRGEVPEWSIGAVSKTVVPCEGYRGFESHPLRQILILWSVSPRTYGTDRKANPRFEPRGSRRALEIRGVETLLRAARQER